MVTVPKLYFSLYFKNCFNFKLWKMMNCFWLKCQLNALPRHTISDFSKIRKLQAGPEPCQAQFKLGLATPALLCERLRFSSLYYTFKVVFHLHNNLGHLQFTNENKALLCWTEGWAELELDKWGYVNCGGLPLMLYFKRQPICLRTLIIYLLRTL